MFTSPNSSRGPRGSAAGFSQVCTMLLLAFLLLGRPSVANAADPIRPYQLNCLTDTAWLVASGSITLGTQLVIAGNELDLRAPVSSDELNWLDRKAITALDKNASANAALISDVIVGTALSWVLIGPGVTWIQDDAKEARVDLLLYSEVVGITMALTNLVKIAVGRRRPITYLMDANEPLNSDHGLSFYSGHSAVVAAIGAAATTIAFQRHRPAWQRWLTLGLAVGLTSWVAVERVLAKKHFPTDVMVGAATGAAIGILIPALHLSD
ncbi:MAG TPA: phosphatase PAP2 family protein [Myxococcales bacterium]|nr:phosphatase PAP2 family protein [Myxococcales bacterium]